MLHERLIRLGAMKKTNIDHRRRLLLGLATVLASKRYQDITIADIAAAAQVSRRTIYEYFTSKDECLLALAEQTSQVVMTEVEQVVDESKTWPTLVRDITAAYLQFIDVQPQLMRALYVELGALGEAGVEMRRQIAGQFADFLQTQVHRLRERGEPLQAMNLSMGMAVVAGINELILYALNDAKGHSLMSLAPVAEELIRRVTAVTTSE